MNSGRQPIRRNRNIGTAKSGHCQDNKLVIPDSRGSLVFWEKLGSHKKVTRNVDGREFHVIVEETRDDCVHPCTVDDLGHVIRQIPAADLQGLNLFVLRQPKRKEQILSCVWGRLAYFAEFEDLTGPAVILEALDPSKPIGRPRSMTPDGVEEFDRLREDGHIIRETKRKFVIDITIESARSTQLYRTLLHEIGHWVDYSEKVRHPLSEAEDQEIAYRRLYESYFARPQSEREKYAHRYADRIAETLRQSGIVPFDRKLTCTSLANDGLRPEDFILREA